MLYLLYRDDTYGSLLYAHGVANQLENARTLLYSLESGEMGIRPGSICYDGYILGCIRSKAWDDVAAAFRSMQKTQVQPSPAACHGILLASLRRGGRLEAKLCLEALRAAGAPLRGEGMILAFKAMLRDSGKINESIGTISGIRNYLRATVESDPSIKTSSCVELIRTLRIAELEDQREETRGLSMQAILSRQDVAWQGVFQSLIAYFDAVDSHEERGSATTQIL